MTLNQLEYFCAVCRTRSIARASEELFVSSPTISVAIRDLEHEFHLRLFVHEKNRISLTEEGEAFYRKAEDVLQKSREMYTEFSDLGRRMHPLKVGIPPMMSTVFFPRMLEDFRKGDAMPVRFFEYGSMRAREMVKSGDLDIALVNMDFYDLDRFNSLVMMEDSYIYCVSKGHPFAGRESIELKDMADESLIFYNTDSVQNRAFALRFRQAGIDPYILMYCSQLYTVLNFVRTGRCGAVLFSALDIDQDEFSTIRITPEVTQKIGFIWEKGTFISEQANRFLEFAKTWVDGGFVMH